MWKAGMIMKRITCFMMVLSELHGLMHMGEKSVVL